MSVLFRATKSAGLAGFALAAALLGPAALADSAIAGPDSQVCLESRQIGHTKILNDHQILFYMNGHEVWLNTLPNRCGALRFDEGFVHVSSNDQYCDNLEIIRVRPTGQQCQLGKFTPYVKPAS